MEINFLFQVIQLVVFAVSMVFILPYYLFLDQKKSVSRGATMKMILSGLFLFTALLSLLLLVLQKRNTSEVSLIPLEKILWTLGLFFSLIGDYFLLFINSKKKKYITGVWFFTFAHLFYAGGLFISSYPTGMEIILVLLITGVFWFYFLKQGKNPGKDGWILYGYPTLVIYNGIQGIVKITWERKDLFTILLGSGLFLFLLSDLTLGIWKYGKKNSKIRCISGWCYFAGQFLIALSIRGA